MPTILTHPAVPLAMALALGSDYVPKRLLAAGILVSMLPDMDVIGFRLGIPYAAELGHRGFSHSLFSAFLVALLGAFLFRTLHSTFHRVFWFLFIAMASHGILDTFTNGGLGVALLWPWSDHRFFAPMQFIQVSPINPDRFFSPRGWEVLRSEFIWVWIPFFLTATLFSATRHLSRRFGNSTA